jgi:hypothetical protein
MESDFGLVTASVAFVSDALHCSDGCLDFAHTGWFHYEFKINKGS